MRPYFHTDLSIAGIPIRLETERPLPPEAAFAPFRTGPGRPRYTARFHQVPVLPPCTGQLIQE